MMEIFFSCSAIEHTSSRRGCFINVLYPATRMLGLIRLLADTPVSGLGVFREFPSWAVKRYIYSWTDPPFGSVFRVPTKN